MNKIDTFIRIKNSDAYVSSHEVCVLSYPMTSTLNSFLIDDILMHNCIKNKHYLQNPPALFAVGMEIMIDVIQKEVHTVLPKGATIACTSILPEVLTETLYQEIIHRDPAAVIIIGLHEILFSKESIEKRLSEIEIFIDDVQKIQSEFQRPVLILTNTHFKHGDSNFCKPALELNGADFTLTTEKVDDIKATIGIGIGFFKLFHLPSNNPKPVSCNRWDSHLRTTKGRPKGKKNS